MQLATLAQNGPTMLRRQVDFIRLLLRQLK